MHAACAHRGVSIVQLPREEGRIASYLDQCWPLDETHDVTGGGGMTREDAERDALPRARCAEGLRQDDHGSSSGIEALWMPLPRRSTCRLMSDRLTLRRCGVRRSSRNVHQHNACEHPLPEAVLARVSRSGRVCLTAKAHDRFGQHGLVGLIVAEPHPAALDAAGATLLGEAAKALEERRPCCMCAAGCSHAARFIWALSIGCFVISR